MKQITLHDEMLELSNKSSDYYKTQDKILNPVAERSEHVTDSVCSTSQLPLTCCTCIQQVNQTPHYRLIKIKGHSYCKVLRFYENKILL